MTRSEAIDALEALVTWVRALEVWERTEPSDARIAVLEGVGPAVVDRCGRAICASMPAPVEPRDVDGAVIGSAAAPWTGALLFAITAQAAQHFETTQAEVLQRAIERCARSAMTRDALIGVEATHNVEASS